jgi:hypothetical protein
MSAQAGEAATLNSVAASMVAHTARGDLRRPMNDVIFDGIRISPTYAD